MSDRRCIISIIVPVVERQTDQLLIPKNPKILILFQAVLALRTLFEASNLSPRQTQRSIMNRLFSFLVLLVGMIGMIATTQAFVPHQLSTTSRMAAIRAESINGVTTDPDEIVARRITVKGDVQGGYYRSCVLNEVRNYIRNENERGV
jgi:hypothetical protein